MNQCFVVHHRHLEHADAFTGGFASQLVGLRERVFTGAGQIGTERGRVRLRNDVATCSFDRTVHVAHFFNVTVVPRFPAVTSSKPSTSRCALESPSPSPF